MKAEKGIDIEVRVDTTQLDEAIKKSNQLMQLLERVDGLAFRSAKSLEKMILRGTGDSNPIGIMNSGLDLTSQEDQTAMLVIEVKDMNSTPVVKYEGQDITGKVAVSYKWETGDFNGPGVHAVRIKHGEKLVMNTIEHERQIIIK